MLLSHYEQWWIKEKKINLQEEVQKSVCIRTGELFRGDFNIINIACIDGKILGNSGYIEDPYIIWWYRNPKNGSIDNPQRKEGY